MAALKAFQSEGVLHRDLHNGQFMLHFPKLEQELDIQKLQSKVKTMKLLELDEKEVSVKIVDFGLARQNQFVSIESTGLLS